MRIAILVNPHARSNRHHDGGLRALQHALGHRGTVYVTHNVRDIEHALRTAEARGEYHIGIAGGDGTLHWIVNEAIRLWGFARVQERFVFYPCAQGTIHFVARAMGVRASSMDLARRLGRTDGVDRVIRLPMLKIHGSQQIDGCAQEFLRYAWAAALGGYGANFFAPWYADSTRSPQGRMIKLLGTALSTAFLAEVLPSGYQERNRWLERNKQRFLRPFDGNVAVDGQWLSSPDGAPLTSFDIVHAGSIPVNLGGVLRVFGASNAEQIHVHVGQLPPRRVVPALGRAILGRSLGTRGFLDGPAKTLQISARENTTFSPTFDGEMTHGLSSLTLSPAGELRFGSLER